MRVVAAVILCALLAAGCTTVPSLQENGIAIAEIVQRVKCEIAFAVPEPEPPRPTGRYQWMRGWTAKVDLTLKTNEDSAITPSISLINPLKSAQTFSLGGGGSFSSTASRTEVLSFTISLAELWKWKRHGDCNLPGGSDLYGNLGLQEWIASALAPVEFGLLRVGRHPPPGGKSPPAPEVIPRLPLNVPKLVGCDLEPLQKASGLVGYYAEKAESARNNARQNGIRDDIQATYDEAGWIYGAAMRGGFTARL
jgi:hypothetical protein